MTMRLVFNLSFVISKVLIFLGEVIRLNWKFLILLDFVVLDY